VEGVNVGVLVLTTSSVGVFVSEKPDCEPSFRVEDELTICEFSIPDDI
jgi:hypothetical protein